MSFCPRFRKHKSFFFENRAPLPHKGWTVEAFQQYCRAEMEAEGFDLTKPMRCAYNWQTGYMVFWQELEDVAYPYSMN